mmetsp:Transcript_45479/g.45913  ORF Transcript_45479/g.45913 Transcript_45479/m.45913 type:complete len:89 (+) Transcript_45479:940-1206(+)
MSTSLSVLWLNAPYIVEMQLGLYTQFKGGVKISQRKFWCGVGLNLDSFSFVCVRVCLHLVENRWHWPKIVFSSGRLWILLTLFQKLIG